MKIDIVLHKSSSMYISENKSIVLTMKKCKLSQYTKKKKRVRIISALPPALQIKLRKCLLK